MASESFVASHVESAIKPRIERFKFTGNGSEYFGIWIVNVLLTIITLGIYSAWAKVRNKQYFYSNTSLDGASFEYTAKPLQILKGRLVALVLFAIYMLAGVYFPSVQLVIILLLFLAAPWIIMKSLAFNAHYSQYRGIRFGFKQDLWGAVKTFILFPILCFLPAILAFVAFGMAMPNVEAGANPNDINLGLSLLPFLAMILFFMAYPVILYIQNNYYISNHAYGDKVFKFRVTGPKPYFVIFLKAIGISLLATVAISAFIGISFALFGGVMKNPENLENFNMGGPIMIAAMVIIYILTLLVYAGIFAYIRARTYNLVYQNSRLGKHKLRAKVRATKLFWLYVTNTLGIALTAGLFIPWAKVRTARFLANNTALQINGDLHEFDNSGSQHQNVFGEEMGDVFDMDIGL